MSTPRRAHRIDGNQTKIVTALRKVGCSVQDLNAVGAGCPDLLVGYNGTNYLIEVKMPKGKPTGDQLRWFSTWHGQYHIVRSAEDALAFVEAL